jgi:hypothetical protein
VKQTVPGLAHLISAPSNLDLLMPAEFGAGSKGTSYQRHQFWCRVGLPPGLVRRRIAIRTTNRTVNADHSATPWGASALNGDCRHDRLWT